MKTVTLSDEQIDDIVVEELKSYYQVVDGDPNITWAIDRVLLDFMSREDYAMWRREQGKV
jgi:hypothetical protein